MDVLALGPEWLDPDTMIRAFGALAVLGVCAVVFAETGLLVGFFLPGDSLLFTAGLLTAIGVINSPALVVAAAVGVAAVVGDQVGYTIGRRAGPRVFSRPNSRWFRREYVERTASYVDRYGGRTVVLARFVPIVRTFALVVAGVSGMRYRTFATYNLVGAVLWGVGLTLLGYWLGGFAFVRDHIEPLACRHGADLRGADCRRAPSFTITTVLYLRGGRDIGPGRRGLTIQSHAQDLPTVQPLRGRSGTAWHPRETRSTRSPAAD